LFTRTVDWFRKLLQSKVVLAHPEAPEDTRVLNLFRNRSELKKALGDAQDELHRIKDRTKLQEAATSRVREQLEQLEARLSAPVSGLQTLVHYQLRDLWMSGHGQIAAIVRERAQQREDRERRQFLADLNKQIFDQQQAARQTHAAAEQGLADVRAKLSSIHGSLQAAQRWWQYFARRELLRREHAMRAEVRNAEELLVQTRDRLQQIEEQSGAKYPGLSRDARRTLNLAAIAAAQLLALRLAPPGLLARAADAMARSEPKVDAGQDAGACIALMQEIARAKVGVMSAATAVQPDLQPLMDRLAAGVKYRTDSDTTPVTDSVQLVLRAVMTRPETMIWDVLEQDLWSLSDLFYAEAL
jgi:hypothetical protein